MSECGQLGMEMGDSFWELTLPFHHRFQIWSLLQLSVHEFYLLSHHIGHVNFCFSFKKEKKVGICFCVTVECVCRLAFSAAGFVVCCELADVFVGI